MSHAVITVSYARDYDRCALLAQSVQSFLPPEVTHHIVVSAGDRARFAPLGGPRTEIVAIEDVWPWPLHEIRRLRLWLSLRCLPMRGWVLQQLVKLHAAAITSAEWLIMVDSDVVFVRPFDPAQRLVDGKSPLHRDGAALVAGRRLGWHRTAAQLLGLPLGYGGADYVANLITWHRGTLAQLHARIAATSGGDWMPAVGNTRELSEYILYGTFVDRVLGWDAARHFPARDELCHSLWVASGDVRSEVAAHIRTLAPEHVALHIQSTLGVAVAEYRDLVLAGS